MESDLLSEQRIATDAPVLRVLKKYHRRIDAEDEQEKRRNGEEQAHDWHKEKMLAIGPDSGRFINLIVRNLGAPRILELGTSFGYSTIWLADAARAAEGYVVTMELYEHKSAYAREMAKEAGLSKYVEFQVGDALQLIDELPGPFDFVLFDHWKDLYLPSFEKLKGKLRAGAILVADNMIHSRSRDGQKAYAKAVRATPGMSSVLLPVGSGLEISRYLPN